MKIILTLFLTLSYIPSEQCSTFYLIRHAEKVRTDKSDKDPKLNEYGMLRAIKWQEYFSDKNISKIYSTYPTVGPIEKELEDLFTVLTVKHEYLLSAWDQLFWPHTSKGYFKLRTKIPAILNTLFTKKELDA